MKTLLRVFVGVCLLFAAFSVNTSVSNADTTYGPWQERCPGNTLPPNRPSIQNPAPSAYVTGSYGSGQYSYGHWDSFYHEYYALDFGGSFEVKAAASGFLTAHDEGGSGNSTTVYWINHGNGWYTKYAHMSEIYALVLNHTVNAGDPIGKSGNLGCGDCGIHLHFELRHGDGQGYTTPSGWSYPVPEIYAPAGWIDVCNTTVQSTPIPVPPTAVPPTLVPTSTPIPSPTPIPDTNKPTGWLVSAPSLANNRFTVKVHAQDTGGSGLSWVKIMSVGTYSFGEVLMNPENGLYVGTVETEAVPDRTKLYYVVRAQDGAGNHEQLTGTNETTIIHDNTPPTGSYVNPPGSADDYFKLRAQVQDTGVGVAWVRMSVWPKAGGVTEDVNLEYNQETSLWQVDFSVSSKPSGTEYQYLLWAGDGFNNNTQITGMGSFIVTHDISPPTGGFVNPPATADTTLTIKADVTDPSGVTWVTISIRPQGQGFSEFPMRFDSSTNLWEFVMDTRAAPNNLVYEYLLRARDHVGNEQQITGLQATTIVHDVTPPTGNYVDPPTSVSYSMIVRAQIADPSGVSQANLHVTVNGATLTYAMTYNSASTLWEYNYPSGNLPLGTEIRYLIHACDGRNNCGQTTGTQITKVEDRQIPAGHFVNVNERPTTELVVRFVFDPDLSGVANATLHYNVNDVGGPSVGMSSISTNEWEARINTSGYDHGTRINYLIHACDNAGNCGQITGLMSSMVVCAGIEPTTWCAKYYNNPSLTGTPSGVLAEAGTRIEYNYGMYSPYNGGVGLSVDNFSAKWSRRVTFAAGQYTFRSVSDEGVRVKIDGNTLFECWFSGGSRSRELTTYLTGEHVLTLEYFDAGGPANVSLSW